MGKSDRGMNQTTFDLSTGIKTFIKMLTDAEKDYQWNWERVNLLDKETQDALHTLELEALTSGEKNKLATRLRRVRKARREHKNIVEATKPLVDFLRSERGTQTYNLLREVQGKTKKIEEYHKNRRYWLRVPKDNKKTITDSPNGG